MLVTAAQRSSTVRTTASSSGAGRWTEVVAPLAEATTGWPVSHETARRAATVTAAAAAASAAAPLGKVKQVVSLGGGEEVWVENDARLGGAGNVRPDPPVLVRRWRQPDPDSHGAGRDGVDAELRMEGGGGRRVSSSRQRTGQTVSGRLTLEFTLGLRGYAGRRRW